MEAFINFRILVLSVAEANQFYAHKENMRGTYKEGIVKPYSYS
jgi:hypothetical protein